MYEIEVGSGCKVMDKSMKQIKLLYELFFFNINSLVILSYQFLAKCKDYYSLIKQVILYIEFSFFMFSLYNSRSVCYCNKFICMKTHYLLSHELKPLTNMHVSYCIPAVGTMPRINCKKPWTPWKSYSLVTIQRKVA